MKTVLTDEMLDYLYALRRRGIKVGLHRTRALLRRCRDPHEDVSMIHVAGTNGKGSTATMIASILERSGRKVGLYTSPHLIVFNERIRVNSVPIDDEEIAAFLHQYRADIDNLGSTFFETSTALTFHHFARKEVDIAVMEVGMGGRLDSSNVGHSALSILTPIDMDHGEYLGHDLASIAREKCGILKEGVPVVVAPQHDNVLEIIEETAALTESDISYVPETSPIKEVDVSPDGTRFSMDDDRWTVPLLGKHQAVNAQTAIVSSRHYDGEMVDSAVASGLEQVVWPGRLERVWDDPLIFYDVAHNPHGLTAVLNTLRELYGDSTMGAVCALKKGKDLDKMGRLLSGYCSHAVATAPDGGEFFTPDHLADRLSGLGIPSVSAPSPREAFDHCTSESLACDLWLIFGTHHLAGDVFRTFQIPFDKDENWSKLIKTARFGI